MFLPADTFQSVVASTPLVSIDLLVRNAQGELLLGERRNRPAQGSWFAPGGRILKNETLDAAFERLTSDELGQTFHRAEAALLGVYEHFYEDSVFGERPDTHYVVIAYAIDLAAGQGLQPPEVQHGRYRWWPLQQVRDEPGVHGNTRAYLQALY
ncbi:GDP-mannose mannosyl hydrolase [Phytopseudomonas dryadis]|uniref:GDP-mannose mannosyl hydrolase n=1 Tax=Phytopseudomonas dryadis TaxID=2487520 RepID=A0A4Q9QVT2_9GAMM|nr:MULTISPECIES: GDP-mannose mannosyl hydrolase [Pseudomonas]TBU88136.1 GDP-mannose mannosyl hydrolase [Pseudomonas dryadis]TBV05415.1 GDP-mannose mannosyl hydrolase [Pseudomonas dryadis]TBV18424.1 GDP-mannose mannosyl hydrolase [Pseudomonas sp. FRB 230]